MKKLILAIVAFLTITLSACTKENVAPQPKANSLADKSNLSQADDIAPVSVPTTDKSNLSQADGTGEGH
jgi:nitrous oxide reductase accessory protein NosL